MPTSNARKHVMPAGTESSFSRETIFEAFGNSIRDVVPVANATEQAQLVAELAAEGQAPSTTKPLITHRADARGLHRVEYTVDGSVWLPASGVPSFASKAAADAWGVSYGSYLTVGDICRVGAIEYAWSGSVWKAWSGDSAAVPLTNAGGTTFVNQTHTLTVRGRGGVVALHGRVSRSAGSGTIIGVVPADFRPPHTVVDVIPSIGPASAVGPTFAITVSDSTGEISAASMGGGTGTWDSSVWIVVNTLWVR